MELIGRKFEREILRKAYESKQPEFIAIYGRRRVGKTYLVREYFKDRFTLYVTGLANANKSQQIVNFHNGIVNIDESKSANPIPSNWLGVFDELSSTLEKMGKSKEKKVIFIDEAPFMDTPKSDFITALEHFWNAWAAGRDDILLIICGSASSWIVNKVIKNHGGLHNRLTYKIRLLPFTLAETKEFLESKNVRWVNKSIAECYMIMGGLPYYLNYIDPKYSLAQNIDIIFLNDNALLRGEFDNLFASLFKKSEPFARIIEILSKKKSGFYRSDIVKGMGLKDGGSLTGKLTALEECGFIRKYRPVQGKAEVYQLIDFFCLFHFSFIKNNLYDADAWKLITNTPKYNTWCGLSFEKLCLTHAQQIRNALGIKGVGTRTYSYYSKETQIDMVIERDDNVVNMCEMKYSREPYTITKNEAEKLEKRASTLRKIFGSRKNIYITMVTLSGLERNEYANSIVQDSVTLDDIIGA